MIRQIKSRLSILESLQKYTQAETKRKGSYYWCKCLTNPNERTPSMQIFPDRDYFRCFSCNSYGDQIDLVAKALNLSNKEAIKYLANDLGISEEITPKRRREIEQEQIKREREKLKKQEQLNRVNAEYKRLTDILKLMHSLLLTIKSEKDLERFEIIRTLQSMTLLEHWLDVFLDGNHEQRLELIKTTENWTPWKEAEVIDCKIL